MAKRKKNPNPDLEAVIEQSERTSAALNKKIRVGQRHLKKAIKNLEQRVVSEFATLQVTDLGRLVGPRVNLKKSQALHARLNALFEGEYGTVVKEQVAGYGGIAKWIQDDFQEFDVISRYTDVDRVMMKELGRQNLLEFTTIGQQAQTRITQSMYNMVAAGAPFDDLVKEIGASLVGRVDARGKSLSSYAELYANDGVMNFYNSVHIEKGRAAGLTHMLYAGNIMGATRDFCARRVMKMYSVEEINSWEHNWSGKRGPALTYRGGWNCRHHWRAVKKDWVQEDGQMIPQGEAVSYLVKKQHPSIDKAVKQKEKLLKDKGLSLAKTKKLQQERKKLREAGKPVTEIRKKLVAEEAARKKIVAELKEVKLQLNKQGNKIVSDVKKGITPKPLTKKQLVPKKVKEVMNSELRQSGIYKIRDAGMRSYDDFDKDIVNPLKKETDRMLARSQLMAKGVKEKPIWIKAYNNSDLDELGLANKLGLHVVSHIGNQIQMALPGKTLLSKLDDLAIGGMQVGESSLGIFRHEFGHHLNKVLMEEGIWRRTGFTKEWNRIWQEGNKAWWRTNVSNYAATNVGEAFAESFAAFIHPKYMKGMLPVKIESYFDDLMSFEKKKKIAKAVVIKRAKGGPAVYKNRSESWAENNYDSWHSGLTDKEVAALRGYTNEDFEGIGESYRELNNYLRRKGAKASSFLKKMIKDLDSALKKSTIPDDLFVYRGSRGTHLKFYKQNQGKIITDKGYSSTSLSSSRANGYLNQAYDYDDVYPVMTKIQIPRGTKGAYTSWEDIDIEKFDDQEILLNRNTKFKVGKITKKSGGDTDSFDYYWEVILEVIL